MSTWSHGTRDRMSASYRTRRQPPPSLIMKAGRMRSHVAFRYWFALASGQLVAWSGRFVGIGHDPPFQALQPLQSEPLSDSFQQLVTPPPEAEHVALIKPPDAGLLGVGLSQDPPNELGDPGLRRRIGENGQDVRERAVPAFLQSLLGDDEPNRTFAGQQAPGVVHFLELVLRAGLDSDVLLLDSWMLDQMLADIVGMDQAGLPLAPPGSLHLDDAYGPDVDTGLRFVTLGLGLEARSVLDRGKKRVAPVAARSVLDVQVELDHLLRIQFLAADVDQDVGILGRAWQKARRSCRD